MKEMFLLAGGHQSETGMGTRLLDSPEEHMWVWGWTENRVGNMYQREEMQINPQNKSPPPATVKS